MTQPFIHRLEINGPEGNKKFDLPMGKSNIGRDPSSSLVLAQALVSRKHAEIICTDTECTIIDLDSANGTLVNEKKLVPHSPVILEDQDIIKIGDFTLAYQKIAKKDKPSTKPDYAVKEAFEEKPASEFPPSATYVEQSLMDELSTSSFDKPLPPEPPIPPTPPGEGSRGEGTSIPGIEPFSTQLINYLPGIYHTEFVSHFLALFESIWLPIEWNVDNIDLFLDPGTSPAEFLSWLASWLGITFDSSWDVNQRRALINESSSIYARRGTRWALSRILEIYTGEKPRINDTGENIPPHTFTVEIPANARNIHQELIEQIINANKPAHTTYTLKIMR